MWYVFMALGMIILFSAAYAAASGAPWVPTKKGDVERLTKLLDLKAGEKFVELGCGNGRVCRAVAKHQPDADITGVELSILQYLIAQAQGLGTSVRFKFQNVFKHDLSEYDAVYLFLMPETYEKIQPKLESELKSGSRVVSYVWPIPGWEPELVDRQEGALDLYLYKI